MRTERQPVSFCVPVATLKCSSAAAAIAARSIVPTAVPDWRGARGNERPDSATKRAAVVALPMRCVPIAPTAACVASLIDRLVHHAEIIAIDGESYRLKEATERSEKRGRQRRGAKT